MNYGAFILYYYVDIIILRKQLNFNHNFTICIPPYKSVAVINSIASAKTPLCMVTWHGSKFYGCEQGKQSGKTYNEHD